MSTRHVRTVIVLGAIVAGGLLLSAGRSTANMLLEQYAALASPLTYDRHGEIIRMDVNSRGFYASYTDALPESFTALLTESEDRYFRWHPGINPISTLRAAFSFVGLGPRTGGSTITQQVAKILLDTGKERTIRNKLRESLHAVSLEIFLTKEQILTMYSNVAYFGNLAQGVTEASRTYFGKTPQALTDYEQLALVATLTSPSRGYPGTENNRLRSKHLVATLNLDTKEHPFPKMTTASSKTSLADFEISSLDIACDIDCHLTIDKNLTDTLRDLLERHLASPALKNAANGAIVVVKLPENELLAIVGSPDPTAVLDGYQINMAVKPRPIGSTAKPFIYLQGFEAGLRPYTLVDDREYKFPIGSGFNLYPKNYDYQYRGEVSLHYALANSLNVPTVKVLEYIGVDAFNRFLTEDLRFTPIQPIEDYELGIALGGLEMDLLTLTHLFSVFPNGGLLKPLTAIKDGPPLATPMIDITETKRIADTETVALVNAILSDRLHGVEQFGLKSNLSLPYDNYAVKTGTSREFHDSWTIGYTSDFVVGVWVGNADDTPLQGVSGQTGAGAIWHDVMQLLIASEYKTNATFDLSEIRAFMSGGTLEYGLVRDRRDTARTILLALDNTLILEPHDGDVILFEKSNVRLNAKQSVEWTVNKTVVITQKSTTWQPPSPGTYKITAHAEDGTRETITVEIR